MSYTVYKHITPNGKIYIGITKRNPLKRWQNGRGYSTNKHFSRAIKKYGWNNIIHKILFSGLSEEEAKIKEIKLIAYYKSNNPKSVAFFSANALWTTALIFLSNLLIVWGSRFFPLKYALNSSDISSVISSNVKCGISSRNVVK